MINGMVNVYKEAGFTSHDVVAKLRGIVKQKKIGHTGTLDPDATGVLPVCFGNATKLCDMLNDKSKEYEACMLLGVTTDTQDISGTVLEQKEVNITKEEAENAIMSFIGEYYQIPPMYSAIKINGKKLYELARQGKEVERQPRRVEIQNIEIMDMQLPEIKFRVGCSKGTYIRTLCEDIAKKLGTVGYMEELQRTKVNNFRIEDSILLDDITLENAEKNIIKIEKVFKEKDKINLDNKKLEMFLNGVKLTYNLPNSIYRIYNNEQFIGIGVIENKLLKRDIVI